MSDSIDQNVLAELKEIMAEDFTILVDTYLNDSRKHLQTLKRAFCGRNWVELNRGAHSLKGSSGNIGANRLSALCAQVEQLALTERSAQIEGLLTQVEQEYQSVVASISGSGHGSGHVSGHGAG